MLRRYLRFWIIVGFGTLSSLSFSAPAVAQGYLGGNLRPFAIIAGTTVTCPTGATVTGDVGVSPGAAITGFGGAPCTAIGTLHAGDATAANGQLDLTTAYNTLVALPCAANVGPNLAGLTLTPGVYCVGGAVSNLTGTLTLNALGNANAVFVFQMSSTLITSPNSVVSITNGGNACGVQWQVSSSATIDNNTTFVGNILALTSITLNPGGSLTGRALARNGAVTENGTNISFLGCGAAGGPGGFPPPFPPPGVPTLPQAVAWALVAILLGGGVYMVSRRRPAGGR